MEQRIRLPRLPEHPGPLGPFVAQPTEPDEQAVTQRALFRRGLDPGRGQRLDDGEGIAHVGGEEWRPEIAAVMPTLRDQRVAGGLRVELGDQTHDRHH